MQLIIREYLGLLRESREFDQLLPDLLAAMDIVPTSRPQIGVRQAGVDLAAIGKDQKSGRDCLYLFVIKRGDIGRKDWDSGDNSVRQSLNQVRDVYLRSNIPPEQQHYLKRIVLCTTGDLKQDVQQDWAGYASLEEKPDERVYELWNGDRVAKMIEDHLLDEYALPSEARSDFRKALALIAEPEYDLTHYYRVLQRLLLSEPAMDGKTTTTSKQLTKALNTVHFALNILFHWAQDEGNLRNALLAAERSVLWGWEALRRQSLMQDRPVRQAYARLFHGYRNITTTYFNKIQPHCHVRDGLSSFAGESVLITEQVFEQVGIVALLGLILLNDPSNADGQKPAQIIGNSLIAALNHNPASVAPCYDGHMIEVSLALLLLLCTMQVEPAQHWIKDLARHIIRGFQLGRGFPIATDSFEDLVELKVHGAGEDLERLQDLSTLLPALAQWAAVFGDNDSYQSIVGSQGEGMPLATCCFQLWYPEVQTDELLYREPAHIEGGTTQAQIALPDTIVALAEELVLLEQSGYVAKIEEFSCYAHGMPFLDLVASRHFRTPVNPHHWQRDLIRVKKHSDQTGDRE